MTATEKLYHVVEHEGSFDIENRVTNEIVVAGFETKKEAEEYCETMNELNDEIDKEPESHGAE